MEDFMIIDESNANNARKDIDKVFSLNKKIVVLARDGDFNRKILENKKVNILLLSGFSGNKNRLKQRDSGLNEVLCKIARDNDVAVGIDFSSFLNKNSFQLSDFISRIIQNIKLCKKFNVKMPVFNIGNRNKSEICSFLLSLGMSTAMLKPAVKYY